jgi:hypothetical protein
VPGGPAHPLRASRHDLGCLEVPGGPAHLLRASRHDLGVRGFSWCAGVWRRPPLPLPGPKGAAIAKRNPPAVPGADRRPGALTDHTAAPLSAPREQSGSPSLGGILLLPPAPGGRQGTPGGALNSTYLLRGRGWPRTYHLYFGPHQAARVFTFFQSLQVGIPTQGAPQPRQARQRTRAGALHTAIVQL